MCLSRWLTILAERQAAADRREQKNLSKKEKAEADRKSAAKSARSKQEQLQTLRSSVFASARKGEAEKVKKGIWEGQVDAAGGEVRDGCEDFVQTKPHDPPETLMHIAAMQGDKELVEWLDSHGELSSRREV